MRRHWSGFAPTQHQFSLHMQSGCSQSFLRDSIKFFLMVGKSQCITTGTLTTPSLCCIFADHLPLFLNTLNSENMSWHHTRQCAESVALRQFSLVAHEQDHVQNDQLDSPHYGLVSFVVLILLLFVYVSWSVLFHQSHTSSSLFKPTPHLLSVNQFPFQNIARVHPRRPSALANSSFEYRWTESSPRPCAK